MIPILLKIQGLYSYQDKVPQIIDFRQLTDAGIFGIFGQVGSGKSTILEAMYLALYGKIERLGGNDNYKFNMMNLQSKALQVDFTFENFEGKTYQFVYQAKRNSRRPEEVGSGTRSLYELINGIPHVLPNDEKTAEQIIGMNFDNFRRTIIIPQGKFQEFLNLKPAERTTMLKTIFHLERFDVKEKLAALKRQNEDALNRQQGQLAVFIHKTPGLLAEQQEMLAQQTAAYEKIKKEAADKEQAFTQLQQQKKLFERAKEASARYEALKGQEAAYQAKEQQLHVYKNAFHYLRTPLEELQKLTVELQHLSTGAALSEKEVEVTAQHNHELKKQLDSAAAEKEHLALYRAQELDLKTMARIIHHQQKIKEQQERIRQGKSLIADLDKTIADNEKLLSEKRAFLLQKKAQLPEMTEINEVIRWHHQNELLQQPITDITNRCRQIRESIDTETQWFIHNRLEPASWRKTLSEDWGKTTSDAADIQQKIAKLQLQNQLKAYADSIVDHEPCPLCGSVHHPSILNVHDVSAHLAALLKEETINRNHQNDLNRLQANAEQKDKNIREKQAELDALSEKLIHLKNDLTAHQKEYVWPRYEGKSLREMENLLQQCGLIQKETEQLSTEMDALNTRQNNARENLNNYNNGIEKIHGNIESLQQTIEQDKQQLKYLQLEDYVSREEKEIETLAARRTESNKRIEENFESLTRAFNDNNSLLIRQQAGWHHTMENIKKTEEKRRETEATLNLLMKEKHFSSEAEIRAILDLKLNIGETELAIDRFRQALAAAKSVWDTLQQEQPTGSFGETVYQQTEAEMKQWQTQKEQKYEQKVRTLQAVEQLGKDLIAREALEKELQQLEERAEQLKIMDGLIIGDKFIKYIATIYLEQLVNATNRRFEKLTHNQMSLTLGDDGQTFMVTDYMNGGKKRNVKTLSGGQTFQISLCIALSLAESVQSVNRSGRNFFFLDEGFGSLDTQTLNVVFDTLKGLTKENKIIGIISHVDSMQEEIPIGVKVINDAEKGSQVSYVG